MKKLVLLALAAVMALAAPVAADDHGTEPCDPIEGVTTVFDDGYIDTFDAPITTYPFPINNIDDPTGDPADLDGSSTYRASFMFDWAPFETGRVRADLGWDTTGDFDFYITDEDGGALGESTAFNPLDGNGESITLNNVAHCSVINVEVKNYLADPTTDLTLSLSPSQIK